MHYNLESLQTSFIGPSSREKGSFLQTLRYFQEELLKVAASKANSVKTLRTAEGINVTTTYLKAPKDSLENTLAVFTYKYSPLEFDPH